MKYILGLASIVSMLAAICSTANADIIVSTTSFGTNGASTPPPAISNSDLGQTALLNSDSAGLFNGNAGTTGSGTNGNPATTFNVNDTVTLDLDLASAPLGYDITGIDTVFGWNEGSNGRSNQGYSIDLGLVGGGTAQLVGPTTWEPNNPAQYWTTVSFVNGSGGALDSTSFDINGAGANPGTGVIATGVESITWTITDQANAGGVIVAREFDVFGTATTAAVPEPSSAAVIGFSALGLMLVRRKR